MKTVSCDDLGAGVQNNYTNAFYRPKMNPWYEKWMPDLTKDGTKAVYTITLRKTDNKTGEMVVGMMMMMMMMMMMIMMIMMMMIMMMMIDNDDD